MRINKTLINKSSKNKISVVEIISYLIFLGMGIFGLYTQIKEFNISVFIGSLGLIYVSLSSIYLTIRLSNI